MMNNILVDVNTKYKNKVAPRDPRFWDFNMTFRTMRVPVPKIAKAITLGYSITSPHKKVQHHRPRQDNLAYKTTYRVAANVIGVQLLGLDSDTEDERSTFEYWLNDPFIHEYGILATTASHTAEKPRCRVFLPCHELIEPSNARIATEALMARYDWVDKSTKDVSRVFYGAVGAVVRLPKSTVPKNVIMNRFVNPEIERREEVKAAQERASKERVAKREAMGATVSSDQVYHYVKSAMAKYISNLEQAPEGSGERHKGIYATAVAFRSFQMSDWVVGDALELLSYAEDMIFDAAIVNGYVAKYGELETRRVIRDGFSVAEAKKEPAFNIIIKNGDKVKFEFYGEVIEGVVKAKRKHDGCWFYRINGILYPQSAVVS